MLEHPVVFLPFQKHPVSLQASSLEPLLFYLSFNTLYLDRFFSKMQSFNLRGNCHSAAGDSHYSTFQPLCPDAVASFWILSQHSKALNAASLTRNHWLLITKKSNHHPQLLPFRNVNRGQLQLFSHAVGPCLCSGNPLKCVTFIQLLKSRWGSIDRSLNWNCALWY